MSDRQRPPAEGQETGEPSLSSAETLGENPGVAARPEAPPPEQIGSYRVERCLGRGGMGEVFLAWDERLKRRVAIKRVRQDAGLPPTQRERFRREARAVARLSHSSIVQVYDLMSDDAGDAIVLEYVEGSTLAARIAQGPLPPAEAVRLGRQIAEGLAAAHGAGLIHRDLKAENVIITPSGQAKILDFGLARPLGLRDEEPALTEHGAVLGTCHAMSPEQAGGGEVDHRSDLFSLGSLLYQMLTGRAPFRGASPLETLKRVLTETPPSLSAVRSGLPAELVALVDRLLAKDREARPPDAGAVAHALQRIEARLPSDRDNESAATATALPHALLPGQPLPTSTLGLSPRYRRWYGFAAAALLLALAAGAFLWFRTRDPARALRVIVARPEVVSAAADPQLELAASGILSSALSGLASLEGLAPIDPREASGGGSSPVQMARTLAADEVLAATLEREEGTSGRVSLRRIQGSDGRVLWAETFNVPTDPESLRLLANSITVYLRRAYPDQRLRPGTPDLEVRDEDYAAFLAVKKRIDAGGMDLEPELAQLEKIAQSSPRFVEAKILAARVAFTLFQIQWEASYLDRVTTLARQAEELAPNDPRPLIPELKGAVAIGHEKEAQSLLARLEKLQPGDPEILVQRSNLAEHQGRLEDALRDLTTAVARAPSWKNLFYLARIEARLGRLDDARKHLDEVLRQAPGNEWARERLAGLEVDYGDLQRAESLYLELLRLAPRRQRFANLGVARFLQGHYSEAEEVFRQALAIDPTDSTALMNLAGVDIELGKDHEAQDLYNKALVRIEKDEPALGLPPEMGQRKAECLARLGRKREAAALIQDLMLRSPHDADQLFNAALVYSLIGDHSSAFSNAQAALQKGKSPRWFTGSPFRSLLADPEFQALLKPPSTAEDRPSDRK